MLQHVALIMDGNRRWAKERNLPAFAGHQKGYRQIEKIVTRAQELGICFITFWAFSTENWKRNDDEVSYLLNLFRKVFKGKLFHKLMKNGGKICVLGNTGIFPEDIQKMIREVVEKSKNNSGIQLNIALNYGGREEIVHAVNKILEEFKRSPIKSEMTIDEELFSDYLYTKGQPDPELIIRTGGAKRLSGYLPWQSIYSELYFTDTYWPDFGVKGFDKAIEEYERRERRFGK
jgi:undecaprenyl diphosphate synthase